MEYEYNRLNALTELYNTNKSIHAEYVGKIIREQPARLIDFCRACAEQQQTIQNEIQILKRVNY